MRDRKRQVVVALAALAMVLAFSAPIVRAQAGKSVADRASDLTAGAEEGAAQKGFVDKMWDLWKNLLEVGGRTMYGLAAASIVGLASVLERAIGLIIAAFGVRGPMKQARALWARGDLHALEALARRKRGITAKLMDFIVRHRDYSIDEVNAGVTDLASRYVRIHTRRNYILAVVTGISPLMGLFGTVVGMIEAFEKVNIAGSMGSAEYLSGAISKALVTTEVGLAIAMPAMVFWHAYRFFIGVMSDTLEGKINEMVSEWLMKKEAA